MKKNNFLKKSIREGNGRDLEEMDFLLLKFYVIEYYIYYLGWLVLIKFIFLGKWIFFKMKLVVFDFGKIDNGEERIYMY